MYLKKDKKFKIVLTGGHAGATAYAVIQAIRKKHESWDIYWLGAKSAVEGKNIKTLEAQVFPKIGVNFLPLVAGRIQTKFSPWTLPSLAKIPFGFLHSFYYIGKIKPRIVVSFGGYASFPVVVAGFLFRVPILIHEQTASAGRANLASSYFSTKVLLARSQSASYFPKDKSILVGNPVSEEVRSISPKKKMGKPMSLLITGGSRGSTKINAAVDKILEALLAKFKVVHQTGELDFEKFSLRRDRLQNNLKENYQVYPVIYPWDWYKFVKSADIIVSRAGANIVSEIMVAKRPSVLIPLAIAYKDEQSGNAYLAQKFGIAEILKENKLSARALFSEILKVVANWERMVAIALQKESPDVSSAEKFLQVIEKILFEK